LRRSWAAPDRLCVSESASCHEAARQQQQRLVAEARRFPAAVISTARTSPEVERLKPSTPVTAPRPLARSLTSGATESSTLTRESAGLRPPKHHVCREKAGVAAHKGPSLVARPKSRTATAPPDRFARLPHPRTSRRVIGLKCVVRGFSFGRPEQGRSSQATRAPSATEQQFGRGSRDRSLGGGSRCPSRRPGESRAAGRAGAGGSRARRRSRPGAQHR
jgi:hypothetical protein